MKRSFLLIVFTIFMACTFSSCAADSQLTQTITSTADAEQEEEAGFNVAVAKDDVNLKVWAGNQNKDILGDMMVSFIESHSERSYDISYEVVDENEIVAKYLESPESAADVFVFPNSLLNDLIQADVLYEVTLDNSIISSENPFGAVESSTGRDGRLYAFPLSVENGYYLFYDRRVIGDEQIRTLDGLMAAVRDNGKKFYMNLSSGFFLSSFFLGAGCEISVSEDGKQLCDFNSETGIKVGEAIKQLALDDAFISGGEDIFIEGFGDDIAAGIVGKWNVPAISERLPEYGASKLPTFTLDDRQVQMGGFSSFMLVGVNKSTKFPLDAMLLAKWITNEQSQVNNFVKYAKTPTNSAAAESHEVLADVNAAALTYQSQFSISRNNVLESFWAASDELGRCLEDRDNDIPISELLNIMVEHATQ